MSNYCAISKADCVEFAKTFFNELLNSVSDYGYLHRTRVGLNLIYRSDGLVNRASASGLINSGIRFRVESNQ